MIGKRTLLPLVSVFLGAFSISVGPAPAQQGAEPSCAETLTEQLRRFSDKCVSDLVTYVASQPTMAAKIYSEKEKYYVALTRTDEGLLMEAVSKANHPLMKPDTPDLLKQLGWEAPENESDNWKKSVSRDAVRNGDASRQVIEALGAYGLKPGEAVSLTIGPKVSDKAG